MRQTFAKRLFIILCSFTAFGLGQTVQAASLRCSESPVLFDFERNYGPGCLCEAATKAIDFLMSLGLEMRGHVTVKLTNNISFRGSDTLFGSYNPKTRELLVLTYPKARAFISEQENVSDIELSEGLWCGFAAHELAHAVIHDNYGRRTPSRFAEEYIACITQLMVLGRDDLENFLNEYGDVEGYASINEMTDTYYFLDPQRFAVKCYRHFLSLKNPAQFVDRLLKTSARNSKQDSK